MYILSVIERIMDNAYPIKLLHKEVVLVKEGPTKKLKELVVGHPI